MFTNYVINIYIKHAMLIYHNIHTNHIHRYTHIYIFKHTYTYTHIHTYTYIHIHTYIYINNCNFFCIVIGYLSFYAI